MADINTLVLPGSKIEVVDAFYVNERGEITGGGVLPNGDFHAVVLVPASGAEIEAAQALMPTSQPRVTLVSRGGIEGNPALDNSRSRMLAPFLRIQPGP
jgi:hypothetical protein